MQHIGRRMIATCAAALLALTGIACSQLPLSNAMADDGGTPSASGESGGQPGEFSYAFRPLGRVSVYRPEGAPRAVILFLSGDAGWNGGAARMARTLAAQGAVVAGIDTPSFLRTLESGKGCINPNYGLINLSRDLQHRLEMPMYLKPIILGYSSGATLAYASLAQGPNGSYKAAVSMGFSADLPGVNIWCKSGSLHARRIVRPARGWLFAPSRALPSPWILLQGQSDKIVSAPAAAAFARQVPGATMIALPGVDHDFDPEQAWLQPLMEQIGPMFAPKPAAVAQDALPADLPITTVTDAGAHDSDMMAVIYSGDGGWVGLDKDVAAQLAHAGVPVVGIDSLSYFWSARTPAGAANDLEAVLRAYAQRWHRHHVLLLGYSFGADVLPHIAAKLSPDMRAMVRRVSLLGLSPTADFQFHLGSWLDLSSSDALPTVPAVMQLDGMNIQCVRGTQESDSACPAIPQGRATQIVVPGGHHFNRNAPLLARVVLGGLKV
ncbi:virulence factor family protein [Sphingobium sp. H39-3-25]|uniref:AcvB/VirJ family lysyl-phosphatidylglycerol hydrolase n=1 Tax=Sphingobium arseniciresistens TaxID=3030834 RepID=UPI0023BA3BF1|nr:virulence factor family protein [Sphingobium arseniciresistens]